MALKSLENSDNFFSPALLPPCVSLRRKVSKDKSSRWTCMTVLTMCRLS